MDPRYSLEVQVGSDAPLASTEGGVIMLGALLTAEEPVAEVLTHEALHIIVDRMIVTEYKGNVEMDYVDSELLILLLMGRLKFCDVEIMQDYLYDLFPPVGILG